MQAPARTAARERRPAPPASGDVGGLLAGGTAAEAGDHKLVCFIIDILPFHQNDLNCVLYWRIGTSGANITPMHTTCKDATCHFSVARPRKKRRLLSNVTILFCVFSLLRIYNSIGIPEKKQKEKNGILAKILHKRKYVRLLLRAEH